jgi:hypothetical protein
MNLSWYVLEQRRPQTGLQNVFSLATQRYQLSNTTLPAWKYNATNLLINTTNRSGDVPNGVPVKFQESGNLFLPAGVEDAFEDFTHLFPCDCHLLAAGQVLDGHLAVLKFARPQHKRGTRANTVGVLELLAQLG